jgi:hypothetical protein
MEFQSVSLTPPPLGVQHRFTIQVSEDEHTLCDLGMYTNHHCEPTAILRGLSFQATRDIEEGEEITFNYNHSEWDMATPFQCNCNSPHCFQTIAGLKNVTPDQLEKLKEHAAPFLLKRLESLPAAAGDLEAAL